MLWGGYLWQCERRRYHQWCKKLCLEVLPTTTNVRRSNSWVAVRRGNRSTCSCRMKPAFGFAFVPCCSQPSVTDKYFVISDHLQNIVFQICSYYAILFLAISSYIAFCNTTSELFRIISKYFSLISQDFTFCSHEVRTNCKLNLKRKYTR